MHGLLSGALDHADCWFSGRSSSSWTTRHKSSRCFRRRCKSSQRNSQLVSFITTSMLLLSEIVWFALFKIWIGRGLQKAQLAAPIITKVTYNLIEIRRGPLLLPRPKLENAQTAQTRLCYFLPVDMQVVYVFFNYDKGIKGLRRLKDKSRKHFDQYSLVRESGP